MHRPLDAAASTDGQPGASKQSERPVEAQSGGRVGADGPEYLVLSLGRVSSIRRSGTRMPRTGHTSLGSATHRHCV